MNKIAHLAYANYRGGSVILSLFDCQAIAFHRRLDSMRVDPKVVVATNVKPRKIGGTGYY